MKRGRLEGSEPIMRGAWRACCLSWITRQSLTTSTIPGWRLHPLKGERREYWSLTVSGNWRVIFRFTGSDIELVDYLDYH